MVWKQDLAKLKQAFREAGGPPPPPVKPKPKPTEIKSLNDEDAMFLAAMGGPAPKPKAAEPAPAPAPAPAVPMAAPQAVDRSFEAGLSDLKGLRPLGKAPVLSAAPQPSAPRPVEPQEAAPEAPAPLPVEAMPPVAEPATPEAPSKGPIRIQLAAGMAVEVDASLDLRNHSVPDALGRLKDRVEDGAHMGWRTLHVILGEDPALHEALMGFLAAGPASRIGRYAQAPIPMGGAQAWVLYY